MRESPAGREHRLTGESRGNFTLLGAVAKLIVAQRTAAEGIEVTFWSYFRMGAPLTIVAIVSGVLLL